jgi:hypothetical protein
MKDSLQQRRLQIVIAFAMLLCLLVLLVPHSADHGGLDVCVLFFPVFLFGLLDLPRLSEALARRQTVALPASPVLNALFQRPPPFLS